jgi:hypothetical protein
MQLKTSKDDPLNILSSTKFVVENAKHVEIRESKTKDLAAPVKQRLKKGVMEATETAGSLGDLLKDYQLVFIEDCVNFCFWAEKDKEKWQVEYPKGTIITGGWYGLEACFTRAIAGTVPILSAKYLSETKLADIQKFFRSSNGVEIPLIQERCANLQNAGRVLLEKYTGQFINLLEEAAFDAVNIIKEVVEHFDSFTDIANYNGRDVVFFKRAQLVAADVNTVYKKNTKTSINNIDILCAFADYKLPQILRQFGVLVYSKELAEKVDNYILLPKGSSEEVEIRAATIWAVELLRQLMPEFASSKIDLALWLLTQDKSKFDKPYHRTYTIYY